MKKILTLCFIYQHPNVLLGLKKRGFGKGKWNGFGGKLEQGEKIEQALKREVMEEAGIEIKSPQKIGIIEFEFINNPEILEVHFYKTDNFLGEPKQSQEMLPKWFNINELPFEKMWPDDKYWFPLFLEGKKFKGKFTFDNSEKIVKYKLGKVKTI
jgi:8-oxo-dGTP diphosphatase / 2-hydroxy-dATP diphosphatase